MGSSDMKWFWIFLAVIFSVAMICGTIVHLTPKEQEVTIPSPREEFQQKIEDLGEQYDRIEPENNENPENLQKNSP